MWEVVLKTHTQRWGEKLAEMIGDGDVQCGFARGFSPKLVAVILQQTHRLPENTCDNLFLLSLWVLSII